MPGDGGEGGPAGGRTGGQADSRTEGWKAGEAR